MSEQTPQIEPKWMASLHSGCSIYELACSYDPQTGNATVFDSEGRKLLYYDGNDFVSATDTPIEIILKMSRLTSYTKAGQTLRAALKGILGDK